MTYQVKPPDPSPTRPADTYDVTGPDGEDVATNLTHADAAAMADRLNRDPLDLIVEWRETVDAATPGPWVVGDRDHVQGASHCACRPDQGPLVWEGRADINGTMMQTHVHRRATPWGDDTSVYSQELPHGSVVALSTSEYVRITPEDATLIAESRTAMPALLTAVEGVLKHPGMDADEPYRDQWEQGFTAGYNRALTEARDAIRDALGGAR